MGATSSTMHPDVFHHAKSEYEANKEKMNDEELFNHIQAEILKKSQEISTNAVNDTGASVSEPEKEVPTIENQEAVAVGGEGNGDV
jgi:hypothetical protein